MPRHRRSHHRCHQQDGQAPGQAERIKQDLTSYNLVPEEWGGDTIMVPVSAHTGEGVDQLLEMILLQADVLQLRANPDRLARGIIIELPDKTRGALATVLLTNGTLSVATTSSPAWHPAVVSAVPCRMTGARMCAAQAPPCRWNSTSVVPAAGDELIAVEDDRLIRQGHRRARGQDQGAAHRGLSALTLDNLFSSIGKGDGHPQRPDQGDCRALWRRFASPLKSCPTTR